MSELVVVEKSNIPEVFQTGGTDALVQTIKGQVEGLVPDVSSLKGRKEVASLAAKIAKSKTYLDGLGKTYVAELKAVPKLVDAERKRMRDTLDDLKEKVRRPLTEWETAETARIEQHQRTLQNLIDVGDLATQEWATLPLENMKDSLTQVITEQINDSWEEYKQDAEKAYEEVVIKLSNAIQKREKHDAEQAELEELRRQKSEQEQKDRDEAMRKEGEDKAKRDAEAAIIAGEAEKASAELRAKEAEQRSEANAQAAVQAEKDRAAAKVMADEEAAKNREANLQHRGRINRSIADDLVDLGVSVAISKKIVAAIAKSEIQFVSIQY